MTITNITDKERALSAEVKQLKEELLEQARIVGMSTDREYALMGKLVRQEKALKLALECIEKLWNIIDDIDTYSDMAKADQKLYRSLVERRQRTRFEETGISADGYKLDGGAIDAIREALAEPQQQEPVYVRDEKTGYMYTVLSQSEQAYPVAKVCHDLDGHIGWNPNLQRLPDEGTALYTSPPQRKPWVGLTAVEIERVRGGFPLYAIEWDEGDHTRFARAIEAKLKEKNA